MNLRGNPAIYGLVQPDSLVPSATKAKTLLDELAQ